MKRIVCLSDYQIPYNDRKASRMMLAFLKAYQPDEIASVGDDVDFPQISRWNRGMEGEYRGDLQKHVDAGIAHFTALREVHDGPIHVVRSNHMDRPLNYVRKYAPGLMGLKALEIPSLLEFDQLGITYHERPYELAPGWLLAHGDESGGSGGGAVVPGGMAMRLARKWRKSVVCGHTHKAGMLHDHGSLNGRITQRLYGMEVGNMMDLRKADYLPAGSANWQQGVGILYVDGSKVTPSLVPIQPDGTMIVEGVKYVP